MSRTARPSLVSWSAGLASLCVAGVAMASGVHAALSTVMIAIGLLILVVWIIWQDVTTFTIPDGAILALVVVAVGIRWSQASGEASPPAWTAATILLDAALPGLVLFLFREVYFRRKGHDGLGFGDVKLAVGGGALVGSVGFFWALFGASAAALAFVGMRVGLSRPLPEGGKIAFGAALAPAIWTVWLWQQWPAALPFATG